MDDLRKHNPSGVTVELPTIDSMISECRQLKSRQAVFRHVGGSKCMLLCMPVEAKDAQVLMGPETLAGLKEAQKLVCLSRYILMAR
jgi:hypothetical protein